MVSQGAVPNSLHLCAELGDGTHQLVLNQGSRARRMREELEDINSRVNNAIQAFEQAGSRLCLERAYQTNIELVEDVSQLDTLLSDREGRRKYQQQVCVFIVGYRRACGQRNQLLSQLGEFFSQHSAMMDEETLAPGEKLELEDIATKVTDALNSAEQGILKLAELNKEIHRFISSAAMTKDPKGSRKKLEKSIIQAKENISHLRQKLGEAQNELEAKDKKLTELLRERQVRLKEKQQLQSQLDIMQKSIRNLSQDYEEQKRLLVQEVSQQAACIRELQVVLREGQADKEQVSENESTQIPTEIPDGVVLAGDVEEEEGRAAESEEDEALGLVEDLVENGQIRIRGIQRDGEADVAELQLKLEKHQISLKEAQRELLEIQVQQLDKVRRTHHLERRRLREYHQTQIRQLLGPEAGIWEEADWMSEKEGYGDAESDRDSINKEPEMQQNAGRSLCHGGSGHSSCALIPEAEEIAHEELLQLETEDSMLLVSGAIGTQENSESQFGSGDDGVVLQPMAEHEVVDPDPMAEGEIMESDPMAEGVVSGFDPMAEDERSESTQSSSSGHTPRLDVSALGITDKLCDKSTQCPEGGSGESWESLGSPRGSHHGSEVRATSSSSDLKVSLRNHQMVNQFTETLHRMLLQKGLHSLAQLLEVPDSCNPEGLPEMHNCLPIVTGQCNALLHGVVAAFSELLASPVSPGALERERDLTSLEEVVPEVRPSSKLTAPLHQGQNKQHVDTEVKTADAGNTQQEEQRHHHSTPENFGPTHNFPDHTTVFFTRLDLEWNLKALRQGLVCGRLPKNTYENVAAVMESYAELQQERLSSLVKSYSSFVRSWEAVRRTSVGEPHRQPVVTKMEGLQRQRAQCWRKVNTMYSERRLQLAAVLTTTLKQVEAQSGIFLIKPVTSWKRRLDSTSKIGTCRKNSIRKGRPSRLASMCSHAAVGLMGSEQILGQPLRTVSKVCSEKGWHESETRSQPLERSETTGKTCPATTPRLPEMDTRAFCVTSAKKNYGSNIQ